MRLALPVPLGNRLIMGELAPETTGNWMDEAPSRKARLPPEIATGPFTESAAPPGLFVLMPTPPPARMRNWLLAVDEKLADVLSPQTKEPSCAARAELPPANEVKPAAVLP